MILAACLIFGTGLSSRVAESAETQIRMLPRRVAAPSLDTGGGEWLNTAGPINLRQLRGKIVILDFWTYCCINCIHMLPELKKVEKKYAKEVVVIGVHSPKFFTEGDTENVREAVVRYEIEHPVLTDTRQVLWKKYEVTGWPTLRILDPEGYVIASHYGEATFAQLDRFLSRAVQSYRRKRLINDTPLKFELERFKQKPTPLRFPGKILADEQGGRLFIADSGHNRIVITRFDGTLIDVVGTGAIGKADGPYDKATFDHPQGMTLRGDTLFVADTENHAIRAVDLKNKQVTTVAGTGRNATDYVVRSGGLATRIPLSSPWDLWIHENDLYVAMAGKHQIWKMPLGSERIFPYAGSGLEDIVDGPLLPRAPFRKGYAAFAQPSGLTSDGRWLYVADSEGSSIRAVPFVAGQSVKTVLGTAKLSKQRLFTFGDTDGQLSRALLQHPIAVTFYRGQLFVADTYNNKIKAISLKNQTIKTVAGGSAREAGRTDDPPRFDEPAGLAAGGGKLFVADTNNHLIRVIHLDQDKQTETLKIENLEPPASQKSIVR